MASVFLKAVSKFYNKVAAVDHLTLEIQDHEFIVFVGPSGCGKSTTLRMIAGLEEVSSGEIYIGNRLVNDVPPRDRDVAMVFQNYALYPHMTVYDNLAFGLKLRKVSRPEIQRRIQNAAKILSIESLLSRKPKALSGGQRQRVAVGRAIVRQPAVFLFDEPLSNLDAKLRVQLRTEIARLHHRLEATMIYVTHDQVEAMTLGDRIAVMRDGRIQQIDTPLNLYARPKNRFVAEFIGSPAMNILTGQIVQNGRLQFRCGEFALPIPELQQRALARYNGKRVMLGIRPENIRFDRAETGSSDTGIRARVELVEPMGNETFVHFSLGKDKLISRAATRNLPAVGSDLQITFEMPYAHFFDATTEDVIHMENH